MYVYSKYFYSYPERDLYMIRDMEITLEQTETGETELIPKATQVETENNIITVHTKNSVKTFPQESWNMSISNKPPSISVGQDISYYAETRSSIQTGRIKDISEKEVVVKEYPDGFTIIISRQDIIDVLD